MHFAPDTPIESDEDSAAGFADDTMPGNAAAEAAIPDDSDPVLPPGSSAASKRMWDDFDLLETPTSAELDAWLDRWLELPTDTADWSEVFEAISRNGHDDLPAVYRRIAAVAPATKESGASFLHWRAIEEFVQGGRSDLVPEIANGFRRLGLAGYDADALDHIVLWAMAAGCDADALALEEHFLPIVRDDPNLMSYAAPEVSRSIFELCVGLRLRESGSGGGDVEALTLDLHRDLGDDIRIEYARLAAEAILAGESTREFRREDFILAPATSSEETHEDGSIPGESRRHFEAMMQIAREAPRLDGRPPGSAFCGVAMLVGAVFDDGAGRRRRKGAAPESLLDCLKPAGMERRIVRAAKDVQGICVPKAHLLLEAHADLLRFAIRHRLIAEREAGASKQNIEKLRAQLGFPTVPGAHPRA